MPAIDVDEDSNLSRLFSQTPGFSAIADCAPTSGPNPLSVMLGVSNLSFLAQTATWHPTHVSATLRRAWHHKGTSFVRVLQRCPVYMPDLFGGASGLGSLFLQDENGIEVDEALLSRNQVAPHNPRNMDAAQRVARHEQSAPLGLIWWATGGSTRVPGR